MKIKEYMTVSAVHSDINDKVNGFINEGWQPIGGISVDDNMPYPCKQAMVKYEQDYDVRKVKEKKVIDIIQLVNNVSDEETLFEKLKIKINQGWVKVGEIQYYGDICIQKMVKYE